MPSSNILVVGATGKQGGAVVQALTKIITPESSTKILALTRNPDSAGAQALLTAHPDVVELIRGDILDPESIFSSWDKGHVSRVFLVTNPGKTSEDKQGIPFIDAAVAHGVKHIVFSSVDRGGDEKSWDNPTDIQHFLEKRNVELHLRDKAQEEGGFTWTILRPVAFLDNWNPGMFAGMFTAMWAASLKPEIKLQLVSVRDIGVFAAKALTEPEQWAGRAVGLAGDELTLDEAKEKFKKVTGQDLPQAWGFMAKGLLWAMSDMGNMFSWFEKEGYGVDITALRQEESSLQDFEAWLRDTSKWETE